MIAGSVSGALSRRTALALGSASLGQLLATGRSTPVAAEESVTLARHRELVQRLFADGVNAGDEALVASLYAPTLTGTNRMQAGMPLPLRDFRLVAPDMRASVDALVAEGDLVAALVTWRGPHPPAGTHIAGQTMHLFRLEQDHIIEQWSVGWDWMEEEWRQPPPTPTNPLASS